MSLLNFSESSVNQLRALLGTYGNEKIGRILKSSSSYVESRWFKVSEEVTVEVEGEDDTYEYKAQEVRVDGSLSVNGIIFDSDGTNTNKPDDPVYFKNLKINSELFTGAVEVGKAYQVEFIAPSSYEEETQYYIIPKGGGGGFYRLIVNNDFTLALDDSNSSDVDLIDDQGNVTESSVIVIQKKYTTANFYEGEILYGVDYSEGGYLLDPFLAGIGGTSA
jgi:hypothetical protein